MALPTDDKIVIAGLSAMFPESKNIYELQQNLYKKIDMVNEENNRWDIEHPEIPKRTGKILSIEKFDNGFFGIHQRQADNMDPMVRILLEKSVEAILDAGVHPSELEGTKTGVFIGSSFSETEVQLFNEPKPDPQRFSITGCTRSMISNRISYYLKLKGPSFNSDTACSSSLFAINEAYNALRHGLCDQALVGGINLCLHPYVTLQFSKLGVLSEHGKCKVFDAEGNGYVRSEAAGVIFLQKLKNARRNYGELIHSKTNCDGFKPESIHFPSRQVQSELLRECYRECNLDPKNLSYLEAHGTATYVGDPEEVAAIDNVICSRRNKPLLVGSVKSNVGHSEPSSGLSSIVKVVLIMEHKIIPGNLHYYKPRKGVEPLETERLKVVVDNTELDDTDLLIGVSNFGFGGGNCHIILRSNNKQKINNGIPDDDLPRLVCVSGRVEDCVKNILDDLRKRVFDVEYIRLYHQIFCKNIEGNWSRGFSILSKYGEVFRSINNTKTPRKEFGIVFGDSSSTWLEIVTDLLNIPLFEESIQKIHHSLLKYEVDLMKVIQNKAETEAEEIFGTVAIQIALIDILKNLEIVPDYIIGIGVGEFLCAYFENCLTLDALIKSIHQVTLSITDTKTLLNNLTQIIDNSSLKSDKWISNQSQNVSAEYFVETLRSRGESLKFLREKSVVLLIGDVQSKDFDRKQVQTLKFRNHTESVVVTFFEALGSLYNMGFDMKVYKLYPKVDFPVSCGTPMISPLIKWHHKRDHYVALYHHNDDLNSDERIIEIDPSHDTWSFLSGHLIEERNLFPATGYLFLVLETLALMMNRHITNMQVVFEKCKFLRATTLSADKKVTFVVSIQKGSGDFEICEGGAIVVTGRVFVPDNFSKVQLEEPVEFNKNPEDVTMKSRDVYKELRLRGYNYKGAFKQVQEVSGDLKNALVRWSDNWIAFMDNLLQTKILHLDTRDLYVPTGIERLSINTKKHIIYAKSFQNENPDLPVFVCDKTGLIKSGGIEIRGLKASPISKKKILEESVLEKYEFVPNEATLDLNTAVRVNMQIAVESAPITKVKVVELHDGDLDEIEALGPIIHKMLSDMPAIHPEVTVLSNKSLDLANVNVVNKKLSGEVDCNIIAGSRLLGRQLVLQEALNALKDNGFIISLENVNFNSKTLDLKEIQLLTTYLVGNQKLVFIQKSSSKFEIGNTDTIQVSKNLKQISWLKLLQDSLNSNKNVVLYSHNEPLSGILGLINCIRREPGKQRVKCVFTVDGAPKFDLKNSFYADQLTKNMPINVFKNSKWGTYRHLVLEKLEEIPAEHCFVNNLVTGDLSSLKWIEGSDHKDNEKLCYVYYSALNFRDVMCASGRIILGGHRLKDQFNLGFEFSGRTPSGKRVMGICQSKGLSTLISGGNNMVWEVPEKWTLEQAATVPCVYATILYAISIRSKLRRGQSILIHSGTGGIGLAAIGLALNRGCTVYTTVGTKEKREFLKNKFPELKDHQIFNSRDTSFEQMIHHVTSGRGVDFVLNSLAEDKLLASVRCLARGGTFLEIGKFDIFNNSELSLMLMEKQASFHGIMLDSFLDASDAVKKELHDLITECLDNNIINPLPTTVFRESEIEQAFRYMTTGKHIGKILVKVRDEENEPCATPVQAVPRYTCNSDCVYIITGGLGGFGLELTDWLILRGAKKIVLTSRRGVRNGYQAHRIRIWKSYGVTVKISTADITTKLGCDCLIKQSQALGRIQAIFNLAVVLQDAILENQTKESFKISFGPKALATEYLDELTRKHCPDLRDFVVFSSVSCGRGNAGQANYGMSNSIMERICEKRRCDGYPGLAIEWGAVGDVGIVADMQEEHLTEMEIGGTLQQRITSCLQVLDTFLKQQNPIVSSVVVAKKKTAAGQGGNLTETVAGILGIKDLKTVSLQLKLSEIGMDSMTAVEIQQTLERDFQCSLTAQDIRSLTFAGVQELQEKLSSDAGESGKKGLLAILSKFVPEVETRTASVLSLPSKTNQATKDAELLMFTGIDGTAKTLEPLSTNLAVNSCAVQFIPKNSKNTVRETVECVLPSVEKLMSKSKPFRIISYSYGTIIALEIGALLEKKGYHGKIICIDASPQMITQMYQQNIKSVSNDSEFETKIILHTAAFLIPQEIILENAGKVSACESTEKKLDVIQGIVQKDSKFGGQFVREEIGAILRRIQSLKNYKPSYKLKSKVVLFKPIEPIFSGSSEDYGLSDLCENPVEVKIFSGNHTSILENLELANAISQWM